jgi:hypothetical protein
MKKNICKKQLCARKTPFFLGSKNFFLQRQFDGLLECVDDLSHSLRMTFAQALTEIGRKADID